MSGNGISDEFNSKLDKLLEKTTKSENPIFSRDDFEPIEFCISPALYREEGIILKKFRKVIEMNGGVVKFNMSAGGHHIIKLVHNKMASFHSEDDLFLSQFILDSLEANKLLNLCNYRGTKTKFPDVNPNHIMRGLESWEDAKRKRDALEETTANIVIDSSESDEDMEIGKRSSYSERPYKRRKQYYSIDEERDILHYIVKKRYYYRVKGNAIWKDMEKSKVCGSRTWQSMKERYLNHIIPKIGQFNLNPTKEEKVLIPFGGNKNVKISRVAMEEATRKSNIETDEEECVKDDHHESISGEPSSNNVTKQVHVSKNDNEESVNKRLNSEPLSGDSCGDNTREHNLSKSTVNDKNPSKQVVKESTTDKSVPNVSSPKSSSNKATEELSSIRDTSEPESLRQPHETNISEEPTTINEVQNIPNDSSLNSPNSREIEELISIWDDAEPETELRRSQLDSLQDISKSFQNYDTGQDKNCHEEIQNRDIGSTQKFEIQNNEECPGDKGSTQEFDPKLSNCVVNLGTRLNCSFQAQELDYHHSKPPTSGRKKNIQQSESVKDLNVSHEDNDQNSNSCIETVVVEDCSFHEKSKNRSLSENSNCEIPLQINSSCLSSVKQNRTQLNISSKMESQSPSKNIRSVKESKINESNLKKKQKEPSISEKTSSNSLHNHSKSKKRNTTKIHSFSSSSISKDYSYTSSSDSEDDIAPKSKRVKNYTEDEDETILDYIYIHNLYSSVKGNIMWVDLEKKKLLPGRSWHSLKERFRKRILPRLDQYKTIGKKIIEKFQHCQNSKETETKPQTKYSEEEDAFILKYIIKYKRYKEIKGRSLWVNMSKWDPLKSRTWESLKNRFLKNIVPNMESYEISDEAMEYFQKALKKKRRPANFKKHQLPRKTRTKKLPYRQYTSTLEIISSSDEDSSGGQSLPQTNSKKKNLTSNSVNTNESDSYVSDSYELSSAEDENVKQINKSKREIIKPSLKGSKSNPEHISQNVKQDKNVVIASDYCETSFAQENPDENVLKKRTVMKRKLFTKNLVENLYEKTPSYSGRIKDVLNREDKKLPENTHSQADDVGDNHRSPSKEVMNAVNIHSQADEFGNNQRSPSKEVLNPADIHSRADEFDGNQMSPSKERVNTTNIHSQADELIGLNQRSPSKEVLNPVNIHSQAEKFDNQMSPSKEVVNTANIHSRADELVGHNQKSPSKEVLNPPNIHSQADELDNNQMLPSKEVVNTANIHSQADKLGDNQRSPSKEVLNPVNIHSQADELVGENQSSPSKEVMNLVNLPSKAEELAGDNQKSLSKELHLVTANNPDNFERETTSVIENSFSSASSGLNVSIEGVRHLSDEDRPKTDRSPPAKRSPGRPKGQKSKYKLRLEPESDAMTTRLRRRLRRRAIKRDI